MCQQALEIYQVLFEISKWVAPKSTDTIHYLEVGVQDGGSMETLLRNPLVEVAVGIDTWGLNSGGTGRGGPDYAAARQGKNLSRAILITGDSAVILPGMRAKFDMIFVDGDHSEAACLRDLDNCLPLLADHGTLVADDLDNPNHAYLHAAVERWAKEHRMSFIAHTAGYGMAEMRRMRT